MILGIVLLAAVESQPLPLHASAVVDLGELSRQAPSHAASRVLPAPLRPASWGGPADTTLAPEILLESAGTSPGPVKTFTGVLDNNTADPPDTDGAVGPNHVVTALNTVLQVQDRSGAVLSSVGVDTFCAGVLDPNQFVSDPHVWYDPSAQRYIFVIDAVTTSNQQLSAPGGIIIAATQTSDPTGQWSLFQVKDPSSTLFLDFPFVGFNGQWVAVSANMFPLATGNGESHLFVFDKAKLYAGQNPALTVFTGIQDFTLVPAVTYDSGVSSIYLISDASGAAGQLHLSALAGPTSNPSYASGGMVKVGGTWDDFPASAGGNGWAPEQGGATLDCGDSRIGNAVYKNGSLWATHTVFLPAGSPTQHSAAQWVEVVPPATLTQDVTPAQVGKVEDPAAKYDYCYSSLAVNSQGDLLVGGTRFSADSFPSGYYSLHLKGDGTGAMRDPLVYQAGAGAVAKGGGDTRWGDYSVTDLDPDGSTFWTVQEAGAGNNLWGTYWAHVDPGSGSSGGGGGGILGVGCGCELSGRGRSILPGLFGLAGLAGILRRRRA